jgi:hypothetical protein
LKKWGSKSKEDRRLVLSAVRKAGYKLHIVMSGTARVPKHRADRDAVDKSTPPRKRRREDDVNELMPQQPRGKNEAKVTLTFDEIYDSELLKGRSTVVNRAPLMTAWGSIVAEQLGFARDEALSIGSCYLYPRSIN